MGNGKREDAGLTADVSDDVIRAALESVEKSGAGTQDATEVGTIDLTLPPVAADEGADSAQSEPAPDTALLERDLREVRAQLDLSVERARETLDRLKDTHERYLRAAADLENYKKRAVKERDEAERFGIQKLLKELLPVIDNLDRALAHVDTSNPLADGISATRRIFEDTLGRFGVKAFTAMGQPFDPARHEAMQQVESADCPPGTVVSELVRGYTLHDRLVRPALVSVSIALSSEPNVTTADKTADTIAEEGEKGP